MLCTRQRAAGPGHNEKGRQMGEVVEGTLDRRSLLRSSAILAAVGAVGLTACTSGAEGGSTASASVSASGGDPGAAVSATFVGSLAGFPFWNQIQLGAESAGKDLSGFELTWTAPTTYTGTAQIVQFAQTAVAANPKAIAVDYVGPEMDAPIIKALDQGTIVQLYNNFAAALKSPDPRVAALAATASGLDKDSLCKYSASEFAKSVAVGDELVFFNQLPGTPEWDGIQNAYIAGFEALGWQREQIKTFPAGQDPAKNLQIIESYLTANPNTKGIICADVISGGPAVKAKAKLGLETPLITWNLEESTFADVESGAITQNVNQQPYLQSYYAVVNLYNILKYGFVAPPFVNPGTLLITKDNVAAVKQQFDEGIAG